MIHTCPVCNRRFKSLMNAKKKRCPACQKASAGLNMATQRKIMALEKEFMQPIAAIIRDFATQPDYLGRVYGLKTIGKILELPYDTIVCLCKRGNILRQARRVTDNFMPTRFEDEVYTRYGLTVDEWMPRTRLMTVENIQSIFGVDLPRARNILLSKRMTRGAFARYGRAPVKHVAAGLKESVNVHEFRRPLVIGK